MTTKVEFLDGWRKARDAIADSLAEAMDFAANQDPSEDPNSPFQRGHAAADRLQGELDRLVDVGLKHIDDEIAASGVIAQLNTLSKKAKKEADKLANATKTLANITKAVNAIVGIVDKIAGLPFL